MENLLLKTAGLALGGVAIVAAVLALICYAKGWTGRDMARKLLAGLIKHRVMTVPKKKLYAIEARILLDGKVVKRLPVEVWAYSRRAAKFEMKQRLSISTGTVAVRAELLKHGVKKP